MSEENRRELEPRFYRAVGATGPQSEKAFPALARRHEKNTEDKFADSQEIAKKVENFYKGTSPNQVITEQLTQRDKERVSFSERVSWLQPPLPAKTAMLLILVVPLIIGLIDVLLTGRIGIITSFAYSITLLYYFMLVIRAPTEFAERKLNNSAMITLSYRNFLIKED